MKSVILFNQKIKVMKQKLLKEISEWNWIEFNIKLILVFLLVEFLS